MLPDSQQTRQPLQTVLFVQPCEDRGESSHKLHYLAKMCVDAECWNKAAEMQNHEMSPKIHDWNAMWVDGFSFFFNVFGGIIHKRVYVHLVKPPPTVSVGTSPAAVVLHGFVITSPAENSDGNPVCVCVCVSICAEISRYTIWFEWTNPAHAPAPRRPQDWGMRSPRRRLVGCLYYQIKKTKEQSFAAMQNCTL